jgi:hypothetical protein
VFGVPRIIVEGAGLEGGVKDAALLPLLALSREQLLSRFSRA